MHPLIVCWGCDYLRELSGCGDLAAVGRGAAVQTRSGNPVSASSCQSTPRRLSCSGLSVSEGHAHWQRIDVRA